MCLFEVVDIFIALEWGGFLSIITGFWQPCADLGGIVLAGPVSDAAEGGPGAFLSMVVST